MIVLNVNENPGMSSFQVLYIEEDCNCCTNIVLVLAIGPGTSSFQDPTSRGRKKMELQSYNFKIYLTALVDIALHEVKFLIPQWTGQL